MIGLSKMHTRDTSLSNKPRLKAGAFPWGVALAAAALLLNALYWFGTSDRKVSLLFSVVTMALLAGGYLAYRLVWAKRGEGAPLFLMALACSGLLYMGVFTPFTVPDEVYHFEATYCLSNALMGEGYQSDPVIMRSDDADLLNELSTTLRLSDYESVSEGVTQLFVEDATPVEVDTGSSFDLGANPPQVRTFGALGITLARLLQLGPYYLLYLGRLFNLAFFIAISYLAYKITPIGKNVFAAVCLLPMTQHLAASYSYDAGILCLSFLVTALILRALRREGPITLVECAQIVIAVSLLAPCKVIYSLIALLALFIPSSRFASRRQEIAVKLGCFAIVAAVVLFTRMVSIVNLSGVDATTSTDLDYRGSETGHFYTLSDVLASPIKFFIMYLRTFDSLGSYYLFTMMGTSLGWFQAEIESPALFGVALVLIVLVSACRSDDDDVILPTPVRALCIAIFCVGSLAAMASMLLGWTFNTEQIILGVQGRYFLPYLPVLLLGIRPRRVRIAANTHVAIIGAMSVIGAIMLTRVFSIALTLF